MLRNPEFRQQSKSVKCSRSGSNTNAYIWPGEGNRGCSGWWRKQQTEPPNGAGLHPVVAMREYRLDISICFQEVRSLEPYVYSLDLEFLVIVSLGSASLWLLPLGRWTLGVLFCLNLGSLESCSYSFIHPSVPENQAMAHARSLGELASHQVACLASLQSPSCLPSQQPYGWLLLFSSFDR